MRKTIVLSRLFAFLHTLLMFASLTLPISSFYGNVQGAEVDFILRGLLISLILLVPIISSSLIAIKMKNMYLYMGIGAVIAYLMAYASGIYTAGYADSETLQLFATKCLFFFLSILTYIVNANAYIKKTKSEWGYSDEAKKEQESDVQLAAPEGATFLNTPDVRHTLIYIFPYILAVLAKHNGYVTALFYISVADVLMLFLFFANSSFMDFMYKNRRSANIPVKTITGMMAKSAATGIFLILLFMLPAFLLGREPLLDRDFSSHYYATEEYTLQDLSQATEHVKDEADQYDFSELKVDDTPRWVRVFQDVLMSVCVAGVIIACVLGLVAIIRNSSRAFSHRSAGMDEIEFLDVSKNDTGDRSRTLSAGEEGVFSPTRQIRNRYKKLIKKWTQGRPDAANTPLQLERAAGLMEGEELVAVHEIYERARYSEERAAQEDLKELKNLLKRL